MHRNCKLLFFISTQIQLIQDLNFRRTLASHGRATVFRSQGTCIAFVSKEEPLLFLPRDSVLPLHSKEGPLPFLSEEKALQDTCLVLLAAKLGVAGSDASLDNPFENFGGWRQGAILILSGFFLLLFCFNFSKFFLPLVFSCFFPICTVSSSCNCKKDSTVSFTEVFLFIWGIFLGLSSTLDTAGKQFEFSHPSHLQNLYHGVWGSWCDQILLARKVRSFSFWCFAVHHLYAKRKEWNIYPPTHQCQTILDLDLFSNSQHGLLCKSLFKSRQPCLCITSLIFLWRSLIEIAGSGPSLLLPVMAAKRKVNCKSCVCLPFPVCQTWFAWPMSKCDYIEIGSHDMCIFLAASLEANLGQCDNFPQKATSNPICTIFWHKVILLGTSNPTCKNTTKILRNKHFLDIFSNKKMFLTKNFQGIE